MILLPEVLLLDAVSERLLVPGVELLQGALDQVVRVLFQPRCKPQRRTSAIWGVASRPGQLR